MTHRRVRDGGGDMWDVWEVYPAVVERRMSGDHAIIPPETMTDARQRQAQVRILVPDELKDGWLAFQRGRERRRLVPIPGDWSSLDDARLLDLLEKAERIAEAK
jgi:hypothetical protein